MMLQKKVAELFFIFASLCFQGCSDLSLSSEPSTILRDTVSVKVLNYCFTDGYSFKEVFFTNLSAVREQYNFLLDTDRDGLSDEIEMSEMLRAFNLSFLNSDTNDDGYRDLTMVRAGIDSNSQRALAACAGVGQDTDRDELTDCEEDLLRTDALNPDTDFDGIPDGLEVRAATNPLDALDAFSDFDQDGSSVLQEIKRGTPWQVTDNIDVSGQSINYRTAPAETPNCLDIHITNVSIMESSNGNLAKFYFLENRVVIWQGDVNRVKNVSLLFPTNILAGVEIEIDGVTNQMVTVDSEGN